METKQTLVRKNDGVSVANSQTYQQPIKITGTLTSRIELRTDYYYSFLKLKDQSVDLPVVFKIKDPNPKLNLLELAYLKPPIPKGSLVELTGNYSHSEKSIRKSFTAYSYQILSEPKPSLSSSELITITQGLLTTTLDKWKEWTQRKDFLFKKLEELKEIETLSKLGGNFLQAYLLLKSASYANYQTKLLTTSFDLAKYLETIFTEVEQVKKHIEAYSRKEILTKESHE